MKLRDAVILLLFLPSCTDDLPPAYDRSQLRLTAEDASCTEAWLSVQVPAEHIGRALALKRGDSLFTPVVLYRTDTTLIDEGLLPSTTYTYQYSITEDGRPLAWSNAVDVRTMDTTTDSWTFETTMLGDGSSSVLYDVAIVRTQLDSPMVLAVGAIYHNDSSQASAPFGVAVWTGENWQLRRIYYNGTNIIAPIRGIWVAGPNDIWLAAGSVFHWDGVSSQAQLSFSRLSLPDPNGTIEKMWGSPDMGLYGVGNAGTIVHRGVTGTWHQIQSGITLGVKDVYGAINPTTGRTEILAVASNIGESARAILSLTTSAAYPVSHNDIIWSLRGVWFMPGRHYYVVGSGIYEKLVLGEQRWRNEPLDITNYYVNAIRGTSVRDVFGVGAFGEVVHFNGLRWRSYRGQTAIGYGTYHSVAVKGNMVVAVGEDVPRAVVARGTKVP